MRVALLTMLAGACSFSPNAPDSPNPATDAPMGGDDADAQVVPPASFRKQLAVTTGSATPLDDFVLSVELASDADLAAHARDDGTDIVFTTGDGTRLDSELVAFDGTTGALSAWVRLPSVTGSISIAMQYGGDAAAPTATPFAAPLYAGVWHLDDTDPAWSDSSAGGHAVQAASAAVEAATAAGRMRGARSFDGTDDTASGGDPGDGSLDFGMTSFSVSAWVNVTTSANAFDIVVDKGGDTDVAGFCMSLGTQNWLISLGDGGTELTSARFGAETALKGDWRHLVAVIDRAANVVRTFTNGGFVEETPLGALGSLASTTALAIGSANPDYIFHGLVDEVRLYRTALTADFIAAEHRNVTQPTQFIVPGPEEQL